MPKEQHCCGLPALDAGDLRNARVMARQTIETLESVQRILKRTARMNPRQQRPNTYQLLLALTAE